ncbi:hypothetical protein GGI42DRAFT_339932 [Trichoderma sp. SZMC 28013]
MFGISSKLAASSKQNLTPSNKENGLCSDNYMPTAPALQHDDYTIGWICALHIEMAAARAMLDCVHKALPMEANDSNAYVLGQIGPHNIVMACLPVGQYGTNSAANVASNMNRSFPSIRIRLMVGIGGGVPSSNIDLRLGDVVVGCRVMQYDMGKVVGDGKMVRTAVPRITPPDHSSHVSSLRAIHEMKPSRIPHILQEMHDKYPGMQKYKHPDSLSDWLFRAAYDHHSDAIDCSSCIQSNMSNIEAAYGETCNWFLDHPTYLEWLEAEKLAQHYGILWLSGKPGAGKSTIMKFVYARLKETEDNTKSTTVSFFFNARGELLEKSTTGMYRSLLLQLLEAFPNLQQVFDDLSLIPENRYDCPTTHIIRKLFRRAVLLLNSHALICIVDALDECDEQQIRDMVGYFEELGRDAVKNNIQLRICFSSRHYPYIYIEHALRLTLEDQTGHGQDLEQYVKSRFKPNSDHFGDIQAQILQKAAGVFMWVVLVVNILNAEFDRGRIFAVRKRLQELPPGLSDLFKTILKRDCENMQELLLCVQWLLYAKRPLKPEEFYFAILSGLSDDSLSECDVSQITSDVLKKFVLSSSKGLAEVTKSAFPTVQFIHESLELQHLITLNNYNGSHYWSHTSNSTLVYILAAEGLPNLIRACPHQDLHLEVPGTRYRYPLFAALVNGHEDAVRALLGRNAYSIDEEDIMRPLMFGVYGAIAKRQTPLQWVVSNNREATVKQLLKMGADIDARDGKGNTALLLSLHHGHGAIMKLLIHHGANIDAKDPGGRTALLMATKYENQDTVIFLLENGADIKARDDVGRTALLMATIYNNHGIAKLLVEKGVEINAKDHFGNTALKLAVLYRNQDIVKLLLENGADGSGWIAK